MKHFIYLLCILLSACTSAQIEDSRLLYKIEFRNISEDRITEYRVFGNGLVNETVIHSSNKNTELFTSKFKTLNEDQINTAIQLQKQLQELDYHNHFPWKEEFYKRGNVIKIEFPKLIKPQFINEPSEAKELAINQTYFYYDGESESPKVFQDLIKLVQVTK